MNIPPTATLQTSGSSCRQSIMESANGMYPYSFCLCSTFIESSFHNQRLCIIGLSGHRTRPDWAAGVCPTTALGDVGLLNVGF